MKKDISYSDLTSSLKTTREVADFASKIDAFQLAFFNSGKESTEKTLTLINENFAKKIILFFSNNHLDINDKSVVFNFLEKLSFFIKKLKVIKLVLAFDPTSKIVEKIHNFVQDVLGIGYVLDIEVSEDILGGAIVIFNGKYNDFTLKKQLEDTFREKGDQIISAIG